MPPWYRPVRAVHRAQRHTRRSRNRGLRHPDTTTRFTRTRLSDIVHPVSSSQLTFTQQHQLRDLPSQRSFQPAAPRLCCSWPSVSLESDGANESHLDGRKQYPNKPRRFPHQSASGTLPVVLCDSYYGANVGSHNRSRLGRDICTRASTVLAAIWRTASKSANSIFMLTAPRLRRCAPISCAYGSLPWPISCFAPCAGSRLPNNFCRCDLWNYSAQAVEDRCAGAHLSASDQIRHGFWLSDGRDLGTRCQKARGCRKGARFTSLTRAAAARIRGITHWPTETLKKEASINAIRRHGFVRPPPSDRASGLATCSSSSIQR